MLLVARAQLVSQRQTLANTIGGLLKTFGHAVQRGKGGPFAVRVRALVADNAALSVIIEPLLTTWQTSREQIGILDRQGEETTLSAEQRNGGFEKTLANGIAIKERESRRLNRTGKRPGGGPSVISTLRAR